MAFKEFASLKDGAVKVEIDVVVGKLVGIRYHNSTGKDATFTAKLNGVPLATKLIPANITTATFSLPSAISILSGLSLSLGQ